MHFNCRNAAYQCTQIARYAVPDAFVDWLHPYPDYAPPYYDSPVLAGKPWADPALSPNGHAATAAAIAWNCLDGAVDRRSHDGQYTVHDGVPRNPRGRTGLIGRGLLGRWGPNHAADPIVTRWKRTSSERVLHPTTGQPILQMVAVHRRDTGQWAIPGGMVDAGESVSQTLRREFAEEALNSGGVAITDAVERFFAAHADSEPVYAGYVDDPRNTDNAWMETVARNFHDDSGSALAGVRLEAGDDAGAVRWMDISGTMRLYASHGAMLKKVAERLGAHW